MRLWFTILILITSNYITNAQYAFEGSINNDHWQNEVFLSVMEDYRTLNGINSEQIISKVTTDASGKFIFSGNQLESEQRIYKLHVDNCDNNNKNGNHFQGHCEESKSILFIAKNTDSISFPLSFDGQMFCDVKSINPKSLVFIKIDSLKEEMKFAYSEFNSKASRDLNNKKWFKTLQDYGKTLNEPLAELYIYSFLSDRTNQFHNYYLKDLKENPYYKDLLSRLKENYPNATYTKQYEAELKSDLFIVSDTPNKNKSKFNYSLYLAGLLIVSIGFNIWFFIRSKRKKIKNQMDAKKQLTKQEQVVLDLILANNTNKDIADSLFVSVSTVKTHINNLYKKLNVSSRDELKYLFTK